MIAPSKGQLNQIQAAPRPHGDNANCERKLVIDIPKFFIAAIFRGNSPQQHPASFVWGYIRVRSSLVHHRRGFIAYFNNPKTTVTSRAKGLVLVGIRAS